MGCEGRGANEGTVVSRRHHCGRPVLCWRRAWGEARLPKARVTSFASGKGGCRGVPASLPAPAPGTLAGSLTMARAALGVRYLVQAGPESGFVPLVEVSPDDVTRPVWWPPAASEGCGLGPQGGRAGPWGERAWWATGSGSDLPELLSAPCWGSALVSLEGEVSVVCACVAMRCSWCVSVQPAGLDLGPRTLGSGYWTESWAPHGPLTAASGCAVPGRAASSPSWNLRNPSPARWKVCF